MLQGDPRGEKGGEGECTGPNCILAPQTRPLRLAGSRPYLSTLHFLYGTQKCHQINLKFKRWKHLCKNCEWGSFGVRYRKALNGLERNNEKMSVGLNDHGHFCLPHHFTSSSQYFSFLW